MFIFQNLRAMIAQNIMWIIAPFLFLLVPKTILWFPIILGLLAWRTRNINQWPKWISASVPLWFAFLSLVSTIWAAFPDQQFILSIKQLYGVSFISASIILLSVIPPNQFRIFHYVFRRLVPIIMLVYLVIAISPHIHIEWAIYNRMFITLAVLNVVSMAYYIDQKKWRSAIFIYVLSLSVLYHSESSAALLVTFISYPLLLLSSCFFQIMRPIFMVLCPLIILTFPFIMPYIWNFLPQFEFLNTPSNGGRLEIWYGLSKVIAQNWFYGWGHEVTRFIELPIDHIFFLEATSAHPHNMAIQAWIEFGIIGAMPLAFIWYKLFSKANSPVMLVTLIGLFTVGSLSYNVWKTIWICLCVFAWFNARASEINHNRVGDQNPITAA